MSEEDSIGWEWMKNRTPAEPVAKEPPTSEFCKQCGATEDHPVHWNAGHVQFHAFISRPVTPTPAAQPTGQAIHAIKDAIHRQECPGCEYCNPAQPTGADSFENADDDTKLLRDWIKEIHEGAVSLEEMYADTYTATEMKEFARYRQARTAAQPTGELADDVDWAKTSRDSVDYVAAPQPVTGAPERLKAICPNCGKSFESWLARVSHAEITNRPPVGTPIQAGDAAESLNVKSAAPISHSPAGARERAERAARAIHDLLGMFGLQSSPDVTISRKQFCLHVADIVERAWAGEGI